MSGGASPSRNKADRRSGASKASDLSNRPSAAAAACAVYAPINLDMRKRVHPVSLQSHRPPCSAQASSFLQWFASLAASINGAELEPGAGMPIAIGLVEKSSRNPLIRKLPKTNPAAGSPREGRKRRQFGGIFAKQGCGYWTSPQADDEKA